MVQDNNVQEKDRVVRKGAMLPDGGAMLPDGGHAMLPDGYNTSI